MCARWNVFTSRFKPLGRTRYDTPDMIPATLHVQECTLGALLVLASEPYCGGELNPHIAAVILVVVLAPRSLAFRIFGYRPAVDLALPARPIADSLIRLDTPEGQQLLFETEARLAFLPLVTCYETQRNQTYCGVASLVMVLNALQLPAPTTKEFGPYRIFTQDNVLNSRTDGLIRERRIARRGMLLVEVPRVLEAYGATVELHQAAWSSVDSFRELAVRHLSEPEHHVIVNYSRAALGQDGRGHTSPLGAYHAGTDRFLILDVARYKTPASWIKAQHLFEAMAAPKSPGSSQARGFVLIRKRLGSEPERVQEVATSR
jgi:hypothetical protein